LQGPLEVGGRWTALIKVGSMKIHVLSRDMALPFVFSAEGRMTVNKIQHALKGLNAFLQSGSRENVVTTVGLWAELSLIGTNNFGEINERSGGPRAYALA